MFYPNSPHAQAIANLFILTLGIGVAVIVLVAALVITAWVRYRRRGDADNSEPEQIMGHVKLETAWTIAPALLLAVLFVLTMSSIRAADPAVTANDHPDLTLIGHQWWWEVRYPTATGIITTANEIHLPAGQSMLMALQSADVIHDFWVPELSRKMDLNPDGPNFLWLQAAQPGVYAGACAEYCGTQHAWMRIRVVVQPPAEFAAWQQAQAQPPPAATGNLVRGAQIFQQRTCITCHVIGALGKPVGPDLSHVASRDTLGAGILLNTPDNLTRWLHDPQAVKPGILMPNLHLSDADVRDLVAYLESLK